MGFSLACGGANDATKNSTFYDWSLGDGSAAFERRVRKLDWPKNVPLPSYVGVSVLHDTVRFSRPSDWIIRRASNQPDEPFIHYVSPNAYSFALYQRRDPAGDPWSGIRARYVEDAETTGARVIAGSIPVAVGRGQGRAFTIEKDVVASKHPLLSRSREIVVRDGDNVVLVQVVHQSDTLSEVDDDLLRAFGTLQLR